MFISLMEYAAVVAIAILVNNNKEVVLRKRSNKSPLKVNSYAKNPPVKKGKKIPRSILQGQQYKTPLFPQER